MEIERKWLVNDWPQLSLPLLEEQAMRQGYLTVRPTVRIREERLCSPGGADTVTYILCIKSSGTLSREEIEIPVSREDFQRLEAVIGLPLIPKIRRTYLLEDGARLEVNRVDPGQATEFWYAEIEYPTEEAALSWEPGSPSLAEYLCREVTGEPSQTMGAYWEATRLKQG